MVIPYATLKIVAANALESRIVSTILRGLSYELTVGYDA